MDVVVLVVGGSQVALDEEKLPAACRLVRLASAGALVEALRAPAGGAVLVSDGLPPSWLPLAVAAVRGARYPVIEVATAAWDGRTHSLLSAACRGVVSGFDAGAAIDAAVGALRPLPATG